MIGGTLKLVLAIAILGFASATEEKPKDYTIEIVNIYKEKFGWELYCTWTPKDPANLKPESVVIKKNDGSIVTYTPKTKSDLDNSTGSKEIYSCRTDEKANLGYCKLVLKTFDATDKDTIRVEIKKDATSETQSSKVFKITRLNELSWDSDYTMEIDNLLMEGNGWHVDVKWTPKEATKTPKFVTIWSDDKKLVDYNVTAKHTEDEKKKLPCNVDDKTKIGICKLTGLNSTIAVHTIKVQVDQIVAADEVPRKEEYQSVVTGAEYEKKITGFFKEGSGWEVTLTWKPKNSTITAKSVNILKNNEEIFKYKNMEKLETGTKDLENKYKLNYTCNIADQAKKYGVCQISMNFTDKATADIFKLQIEKEIEIGKEAPKKEEIEHEFIDQAKKPTIETLNIETIKNLFPENVRVGLGLPKRPTVKCVSEGVPAPKLVWTGGKDKKEIKVNDTDLHTSWNATTKRWDSSAFFNVTKDEELPISCFPQQIRSDGTILQGESSNATDSSGRFVLSTGVFVSTLLVVASTYVL